MELKFVVPDMAETFGKLSYAGEGEIITEGYGRNTTVIGRSYHLYSSKQRADDIEVVVAAEAGEKDFDQDQPLKAVNPHLVAKGYEIENRGFTDYVLYVDDLVKEEEEKKLRLTEGIVVDSVLTFGKLRFSALRREVRKQNEDGTVSNEVKERTYNLKSSAQGRMIQVSIPANVPLREFAYDAEVELVNPIVDTVANYVFREGTTVNWFIKADDLVLKRQPNQGNSTNQIEGKT